MPSNYGQDSIKQLKGADRVRLKPEVIFGSKTIEGCKHAIFEIISNSIDEAKSGFGNKIIIEYKLSGEVSVTDYGRGIPMDYNKSEEDYNWRLVFCEMYAGGKYVSGDYKNSLGLNGLGACATQYSSEYMRVRVLRPQEKTEYIMQFAKGEPVGELIKNPYDGEVSGTRIEFKPDYEVFDEIIVDKMVFYTMASIQSMLVPGLEIVVKYEGEKEISFKFENGIAQYCDEITKGSRMTADVIYQKGQYKGRDRDDKNEYEVEVEMAMTFTRENGSLAAFHNNSELSYGGSSVDGTQRGLLRSINRLLKENNKYNRGEKEVTIKDVLEVSVVVVNTMCEGLMTSYENQTKKAINNKLIGDAMSEFSAACVNKWYNENRAEAEKVLDLIIATKRGREDAERVKKEFVKKISAPVSDVNNRPEKFKDCRTKDIEQREIFILEGDSAAGAVTTARDATFQALIPVRGKIMNCLKEDMGRILKSQIIVDLIRVMGCGIETDKKYKELDKFDIGKLNWGKVIICTDADVDGMQIRCLLLLFFYRLMPELLRQNKVFIAETPLYEVAYRNKVKFAYNEQELEQVMEQFKNDGIDKAKLKIQRSKGLGENEPEMLSMTTLKPETRRLTPVKLYDNDIVVTNQILQALLGDDIASRKKLITEYARLSKGLSYAI